MKSHCLALCFALFLGCLLPVGVEAQAVDAEPATTPASEDAPRQLTARNVDRTGKKKLTPPTGGAGRTSGQSGWWTTAAGLMVVLGMILGAMRLFKKHLPGTARFLPPQAVQVLGKRPLDYKQNIYLLRCGSKILVVGASAQGLTTLGEITEPVEVDYLAGLCQAQDQQSVGETFSQLFRQFRPEPLSSDKHAAELADVEHTEGPARGRGRQRDSRFGRLAESSLDPALAEGPHA